MINMKNKKSIIHIQQQQQQQQHHTHTHHTMIDNTITGNSM